MWAWLRSITDRIMGRNAATRMAMDADMTRPSRPPPPARRGRATVSKFTCPGFRPVKAVNATEAAEAFAKRAAACECGSDGYISPMSIRLLRSDGAKTTFAACIRCHEGRGIAEGYDVYLTVEEVAEPASTRRMEPR
jgi:hypothetical protein